MDNAITTIEDLARLIPHTMASKEDIQEVQQDTQQLREEMNSRLDYLDARVGRIEAAMHELRDEVVHRHEFEDALARITYREKKVGIESGV